MCSILYAILARLAKWKICRKALFLRIVEWKVVGAVGFETTTYGSKILPERLIDSQELYKPDILDYFAFMLFMGQHQLHGHVLPLSYLFLIKMWDRDN